MKTELKKVIIEFHENQIPVYCKDDRRKVIDMLLEVLERKLATGRRTVQRFLATLDSVEIEGSEAILYSTRERGTLALSLY
ncbi:3-dehydroquinate dehydratase [Cohnella pontilimi]|uniref:3-dehydroquinate dehydratase n=1 Tax=Cohnella pontilimi TaxID=2564100 RepID=A0A4U0F5H2_9BACL|nr:3-dehydroquinate dehydratase [Cohnella pontilimi]TJY39843.1 3-dehydroquinate dehydratase [Cohnella pontilimi]